MVVVMSSETVFKEGSRPLALGVACELWRLSFKPSFSLACGGPELYPMQPF